MRTFPAWLVALSACTVDASVVSLTEDVDGPGPGPSLVAAQGDLPALSPDDDDTTTVPDDEDVAQPTEETDGADPADPADPLPVDTDLPIDTDVAPPPPPPPLPAACDPAVGWVSAAFAFPQDALSCNGPQANRYDGRQGLWVGVVSCGGTSLRMYLAPNDTGPYVQATDLAGHGQDHCELIQPGFQLPNEDDITSGGCLGCATSRNLPIENVPAYGRAFLGDGFQFYRQTGAWSWQTSQIDCDTPIVPCVP